MQRRKIEYSDLTYNGNPLVKRDGVEHNFTKKEIIEYAKCMKDPAYFAKNYIKIIHIDRGLVPFDLYDYQENMMHHFKDNQFSICLSARQSGKSITVVVFLLWYAIFHSEQNIFILANKGATAREMLSRITLALENLPFFLQPGCKALNKGSIHWSNNSKITAAATTSSSIRGQSCSLLALDELGFVERAEEFYKSTYPVITSGKNSKVIITSTANGTGNLFHRLWEGALTNTNEFKPIRVDWWQVPGRDEKWKKQTISNTSETQFRAEFGNDFLGTSDTLISNDILLVLKAQDPIDLISYGKNGSIKIYEKEQENHNYIMTVDTAKGRGQDYSTFTIIDISTDPFKQVVTYRNNLISPLLLPDIIVKYAKIYNEALVLIENNSSGETVCSAIYYEHEYENLFVTNTKDITGLGVNMTKKVRRIGCSNLKDLIEQKKLDLYDNDTISELLTFTSNGSRYEASGENTDDLVLNLILFAWFVSTEFFSDISQIDLKKLLFNERQQTIEEDVVPFGFIDDGDTYHTSSEKFYDKLIESQKEWAKI